MGAALYPHQDHQGAIMRWISIFWIAGWLMVSMAAHAQGIYRWTDEDGRVHFGDRPVHMDAEKVKGAAAGDPETVQRLQHQQELLNDYQQQRGDKKAESVTAISEQKDRAAKCDKAKGQLNRYQNARFLYKKTDDGEREVLSDSERKAAETKAQAQVTRFCG